MAIDQRDVSAKLRFMDDRALQQYAAMHKNDPYIFPLAFQESQNRQKLRMGQQTQAGAMPQPKVADAALAQMMPETQGIGALPAQNMQGMADGGIAGYADGDLVANNEPVIRMADGGVARYQVGGPTFDPATGVMIADPAAYGGADDRTLLERLGIFNPENRRALEKAERAQALRDAEAKTPGAKAAAAAAPTTTTPAPTVDAAPKVDTTRQPRPDAGLAAIAAPKSAPEKSAAQRYADMQKEMGMGPEAGADVEWKRAQLAERMRAQSKGELEDFEKDVAARGEAFKGREERLAKREAGLDKMKDENTGLSLLEAGLAIMSTPGSLATAIGKGAQAGLKTYGSGLKDLRAAQEKMDDARDQIEEFRRNEANMTAKERREFKNQINRTETEIEKLGVDAAEKMYGYKREDAKNVFTADTQERLTKAEIASKEKIANAQISATLSTPERQMWNQALAKHNGDTAAAFKELQTAKAEKFNAYQSYADYLKAFAGKETLTPPQDFSKYVSQFAIPTTTAPGKGATVLKQP